MHNFVKVRNFEMDYTFMFLHHLEEIKKFVKACNFKMELHTSVPAPFRNEPFDQSL